jgi:hypothetical protein
MVKSRSAKSEVSGISLIPVFLLNYASFEGLYREENIYHDLGPSADTDHWFESCKPWTLIHEDYTRQIEPVEESLFSLLFIHKK